MRNKKWGRWTPEEVKILKENWKAKSDREIAKLLGRAIASVRAHRWRIGLKKIGRNNPWLNKHHSERMKKDMSEWWRRKYPLNENYFSQSLDAARVYWIFFLIADGNISRQNQLSLSSKDRDHVEKFRLALNYPRGKISQHHKMIGKKKCEWWAVRIRSLALCNSLIKFGIVPNKSSKTYIPFNQIPSNLLKHGFRGLVDGDGSLYFSKSAWNRRGAWQVSLYGTEQIATDFQKWVSQQTGYTGYASKRKGREGFSQIIFGGNTAAWQITRLLYEKVPPEIRLERKYQKYLDFKRWREKEMKICPHCGEKFYPQNRRRIACGMLECRLKQKLLVKKDWETKNKEKMRAYHKKYHREWELKNRERRKLYRQKNRERRNAYGQVYRQKNKVKIRRQRRKRYRQKKLILSQTQLPLPPPPYLNRMSKIGP